jgi:G:T/U-mismatch repair DNA glycosylase
VRNATRQVGSSSAVDITASLTNSQPTIAVVTNGQNVTWVYLPFVIGDCFISTNSTSVPAVRFHAEQLFQ